MLAENINWLEKERKRGREKYKRLYSDKSNNNLKPSICRGLRKLVNLRILLDKNQELHHWNYNYPKSFYILNIRFHKKIHKKLKFDESTLCFYYNDVLLDTIEKHTSFLKEQSKELSLNIDIIIFELTTNKTKTMEIYKKMCAILKDVEYIKKDKKNVMQGFMFRGIDDMYNALHDLFAKHEVFICSDVLELTREERQTAKGGNLIYTILKIRFTFYTIDGSQVESIMIGEAMDSGDKSANKAMSTALKYALMQAFLIPTEELKDSDSETYQVAKKEPKIIEIPEIKPPFFKGDWNGEITDNNQVTWNGKVYQLSTLANKQLRDYIDSELEKDRIMKEQQIMENTIDSFSK